MKQESLVIAGQPYGGEFVLGPCTLAWRTPPVEIGVETEFETEPLLRRIDGAAIQVRSQCRSNSLFTRGIRAVRGGTTTAPLFSRTHPSLISDGQLCLEHRVRLGLAQWDSAAPNNASSQTKNYEIAPFILG
ncbi:hypothetical protein LUZ60_017994 [Juncus effusus]|nr:hypothetical protein LUZ60_017994 [Juncus effusus]